MEDVEDDYADIFHETLVDSSKNSIIAMQNLIETINQDKADRELIIAAKEAEDRILELIDDLKNAEHLDRLLEGIDDERQRKRVTQNYDLILSAIKNIEDVNIVQASKEVAINPFDILIKQKLRSCCKVVIDNIKGVVSSAGLLQHAIREDINEEDNKDVTEIVEVTKRALLGLQKLKQMNITNEKELNACAKDITTAIQDILGIAKPYDCVEALEKLKDAVVMVLTCARILVRNPEDIMFRNQMTTGMTKVTESIKQVLEIVRTGKINGPIFERPRSMSISLNNSNLVNNSNTEGNSEGTEDRSVGDSILGAETPSETSRRHSLDAHTADSIRALQTAVSLGDNEDEIFQQISNMFNRFMGPLGSGEFARLSPELKRGLLREISGELKEVPVFTDAPTADDFLMIQKKYIREIFIRKFGVPIPGLNSPNGLQSSRSDSRKSTKNEEEIEEEKKINQEALILSSLTGENVSHLVSLGFELVSSESKYTVTEINATSKSLMLVLKRILDLVDWSANLKRVTAHKTVHTRATNSLENSPAEGKPMEDISAAIMTPSFLANLLGQIQSLGTTLQSMGSYLCTNLLNLGTQVINGRIMSIEMQLCTAISVLVSAKEKLLDTVQTVRYVQSIIGKMVGRGANLLSRVIEFTEDEANIWDEYDERMSRKPKGGLIKSGTLNTLVESLTSEDTIDNKFVKTFIHTYKSFTSPSKLLEKLIQRFEVPLDKVSSAERIRTIQVRVGISMKNWVEIQFEDFDQALVSKLFDFYSKKLAPRHPDLAKLLQRDLWKRVDDRTAQGNSLRNELPITIETPNVGNRLFVNYFMAFSESEIARQLTCIDFETFSKIKPAELQHQVWLRGTGKYLAPNVLSVITRLNRVSMWVATTILLFDDLKERAKVFEKMIMIAEELKKIKNFMGLMGFIAGFNVASVARLARTTAEVPVSFIETLRNLEKLMSMEASYKNYRTALMAAQVPCLPFIGTYLQDLIFIDEGNKDTKNGKINFEKWELTYARISEIVHYQSTPFTFPRLEPLRTFLSDFPTFDEKELFELSLKYEPRVTHSVEKLQKDNSKSNNVGKTIKR